MTIYSVPGIVLRASLDVTSCSLSAQVRQEVGTDTLIHFPSEINSRCSFITKIKKRTEEFAFTKKIVLSRVDVLLL